MKWLDSLQWDVMDLFGVHFNFMLPHYKKIYDLFLEGKVDEARKLQGKSQ